MAGTGQETEKELKGEETIKGSQQGNRELKSDHWSGQLGGQRGLHQHKLNGAELAYHGLGY